MKMALGLAQPSQSGIALRVFSFVRCSFTHYHRARICTRISVTLPSSPQWCIFRAVPPVLSLEWRIATEI
jgi:hypothetical protein